MLDSKSAGRKCPALFPFGSRENQQQILALLFARKHEFQPILEAWCFGLILFGFLLGRLRRGYIFRVASAGVAMLARLHLLAPAEDRLVRIAAARIDYILLVAGRVVFPKCGGVAPDIPTAVPSVVSTAGNVGLRTENIKRIERRGFLK